MITRRTVCRRSRLPSLSPAALSLLLVLVLVVAVALLVVAPVRSSAFEALSAAASVNDTATSAPPAGAAAIADFVASDAWQTVQPGQAIPAGLWVRIDMTTGYKTARLLPNDDDDDDDADSAAAGHTERLESAGLVVVPKADSAAPAGSTGTVYDDDGSADSDMELEREHCASPSESCSSEDSAIPVTVLSSRDEATPAGTLGAAALDLPPSTFSNPTPAQLAALKAARAARLRELASAFHPTDDLAVIKQLLSVVMTGGAANAADDEAVGVDGVLQAMELLESLVHQVDNAADFVQLGGLDMLLQVLDASTLQRSLPSSLIANQQHKDEQAGQQVNEREQARRLASLQESAAWLLGTAAQNNPTVKKEAMKEQTILVLLQLVDHTEAEVQRLHAGTDQADSDGEMRYAWRRVQAKVLYALSSLLRSFPEAQTEFYHRRGSDRLHSLLASTAPTVSSLDKHQQTVYGKTVALLSDLVQDRLINDVNASSSLLFDQLTSDHGGCPEFVNVTFHTAALLHHATEPFTSLSLALSALKTADVVFGTVKLMLDKSLCLPVFAASTPFRAHIEQRTASIELAAAAVTAEDDSRRYFYMSMLNKLQAIAALLPPAASSPASSPAASVDVSEPTSAQAGVSVLGVALAPCSSSPLTGYHRDAYCRHNPNDGGRHLICAQLSDAFLSFSQQRGNDLITARHGFDGLRSGDRWCVCVDRWREAMQEGVAPGVLLHATNARAEELVSRQALLAHAVVDGPSVSS